MHGLYLLWWVQEKHVPVGIVAALLAAGDLAITALEIPTGWLADRFGHRISLIAGSLAQVGGIVLCWIGEGAPGLVFAVVLVALGDAFRSGADQALLYRSCVALDREPDFQAIEARSRSLQLAAMVAFILAGGLIVHTWGYAVGWLVEAIVSTIGLAIACAMMELPAGTGESRSGTISASDPDSSAGGWAINGGVLAMLIAPASLLGAAASAAAFVAQTSGATNPARNTVLVAIVTLVEAAGSAIAARLGATVATQMVLASLGAAATVASLVLPAVFLPTVVTLSFLLGIAQPLRATAIQRVAADDVRARAASVASACDKAIATIALLCAGSLSRRSKA